MTSNNIHTIIKSINLAKKIKFLENEQQRSLEGKTKDSLRKQGNTGRGRRGGVGPESKPN